MRLMRLSTRFDRAPLLSREVECCPADFPQALDYCRWRFVRRPLWGGESDGRYFVNWSKPALRQVALNLSSEAGVARFTDSQMPR